MKDNNTYQALRVVLSAVNSVYPNMINNQVRDIKKTQDPAQKSRELQKLMNNPGFWNHVRKITTYKLSALFPTVTQDDIEDACSHSMELLLHGGLEKQIDSYSSDATKSTDFTNWIVSRNGRLTSNAISYIKRKFNADPVDKPFSTDAPITGSPKFNDPADEGRQTPDYGSYNAGNNTTNYREKIQEIGRAIVQLQATPNSFDKQKNLKMLQDQQQEYLARIEQTNLEDNRSYKGYEVPDHERIHWDNPYWDETNQAQKSPKSVFTNDAQQYVDASHDMYQDLPKHIFDNMYSCEVPLP